MQIIIQLFFAGFATSDNYWGGYTYSVVTVIIFLLHVSYAIMHFLGKTAGCGCLVRYDDVVCLVLKLRYY